MPIIKILPHASLCPKGNHQRGARHQHLRSLAREPSEIEHACDMSAACTTCHVIVREGFNAPTKSKKPKRICWTALGGLEANPAFELPGHRGGQDLTIEIPKYTINHAARITDRRATVQACHARFFSIPKPLA